MLCLNHVENDLYETMKQQHVLILTIQLYVHIINTGTYMYNDKLSLISSIILRTSTRIRQ